MNKVFFGDCRDSMRQLIKKGVKVQCCVTSPPYFGLRNYGHTGQIGLEKTPDEFVTQMVEVFDLVRSLLADDGTLWLNLGDSYAGAGYSNHANTGGAQRSDGGKQKHIIGSGLRSKNLIGIPWRVALALQAAGWYLRQDIIWAKPNPMPESVTDRCTKSHEYLFLLTKSERYYFDQDAIKEEATKGASGSHFHTGKTAVHHLDRASKAARTKEDGKRNKRSVWTIPTQPYSGAHFAVFPEALVEPCVLAGSRTGDIVLDPFFGSGTTGSVAQRLGRQWIGCELNEEYEQLQNERTRQSALAF